MYYCINWKLAKDFIPWLLINFFLKKDSIIMGTELTKWIDPNGSSGPAEGLISILIKKCLPLKSLYRAGKAYRRYVSHGVRDPQFLINAGSSICAGGSLLTLGSAKILSFTSLSPLTATLMSASISLSTLSDTLDGSFTISSVPI